jgi:hypothetical protein
MRSLLLVPIITVLLSSSPPAVSPIRIGATGSFLPDDDVAQLVKLAERAGGKAWVVAGDAVPQIPGSWFVSVYLTPDRSNGDVRRGRVEKFRAPLDGPAAYKRSKVWTRMSVGESAQVVVHGRAPDLVLGSGDLSRPFVVTGTIQDDALASLVAFIRTSPKPATPQTDEQGKPLGYPFERVDGLWPIESVTVKGYGVQVALVDHHDGMSGQIVVLRSEGPSWIVERISKWEMK